jgi:hypothetical protein
MLEFMLYLFCISNIPNFAGKGEVLQKSDS